ncbi:NAD(P)-binding protein [Ramaria rubella]|nr:NAD(P)-binding protein [Ramaria rubella]
MSIPSQATHIVLSERPSGPVTSTTFSAKSVPIPDELAPGDVLVRVDWLSLDPAMRGWLNDRRSYIKPVQIGEIMRAQGLGTVVKGGGKSVQVKGWGDYVVLKETELEKFTLPEGAYALDFISTLGMPGKIKYIFLDCPFRKGLFDVGKVKSGETLVVSGAAGAVGSVVCQLGKIKGARVIALAGSDDKVAWLENELGVDKALNYKSPTFVADFKQHVGYLDVYFDNVGGETLDLCLGRLNKGARIALCGAISAYNEAKPRGLQGYLSLISQRAKIEGFIVFDYADRFEGAIQEMSGWISEGKIKRKFHIVEGLEKCPEYLNLLYSGGNTGKLVVKVSQQAQPPTNSKL